MTDSESSSSAEGPAAGGSAAEETPVAASRVPYGPPIHEAIASGDLQRMKAVAEGARKALYTVEFDRVPPSQAEEVKDALLALNAAIARLEGKG